MIASCLESPWDRPSGPRPRGPVGMSAFHYQQGDYTMSDTATPARRPTRRQFVTTVTGTALGAIAAPAIVRGRNLNDKLNIAMIATGGRGGFNLKQAAIASENIVVLCDVYEPAVDEAAQMYSPCPPLQRLPPGLRPRQRLRRGGR